MPRGAKRQARSGAVPECFSRMRDEPVPDPGSAGCDRALQLFGGYGYMHDYGMEKLVRDLRVHQILEGTNEIMRVIVARNLIGR